MVADKEWSKVDPKDAQIAALTTLVSKLTEKKVQCLPLLLKRQPEKPKRYQTASYSTFGEAKISKIRLNAIDKCGGGAPTINTYGGHFDGIYMPHKPSEHSTWKEQREKCLEEWKERHGKKEKLSEKKKNESLTGN